MITVITAAELLTPAERIESPVVVIEDKQIVSVQPETHGQVPGNARHLDFPGMVLAPGFIDIHIHGGNGHDVMRDDEASLSGFERRLARHGTTAYLPTTVTASMDRTCSALEHLGKRSGHSQNDSDRARSIGIHLEGPFIGHTKRGVHPPEHLLLPSPAALDRFWQASEGALRIMTIAPEVDGALETIEHAVTLGLRCSLGHSNATYEEAMAGVWAGAVHATHTFNAMRPLDRREPGILGAVLGSDALTADIIADGVHLHPSVVSTFLNAKGEDKALLITDAISAAGMPDGTYALGPFTVQVTGDRCEHEGRLAGSVLDLDRGVRNVMEFAGWKLQQAIKLVTINPARLLGISDTLGLVAPGRRADLVVLTREGKVVKTIVGGNVAG